MHNFSTLYTSKNIWGLIHPNALCKRISRWVIYQKLKPLPKSSVLFYVCVASVQLHCLALRSNCFSLQKYIFLPVSLHHIHHLECIGSAALGSACSCSQSYPMCSEPTCKSLGRRGWDRQPRHRSSFCPRTQRSADLAALCFQNYISRCNSKCLFSSTEPFTI